MVTAIKKPISSLNLGALEDTYLFSFYQHTNNIRRRIITLIFLIKKYKKPATNPIAGSLFILVFLPLTQNATKHSLRGSGSNELLDYLVVHKELYFLGFLFDVLWSKYPGMGNKAWLILELAGICSWYLPDVVYNQYVLTIGQ